MVKHSAYSNLKVFHHRSCIDAMAHKIHIAPVHVQLIPTNRCNQACVGCAYRTKGYSSSQMFHAGDEIPWSKLVEVVEDCRAMGVRAIQLTGGGEPTVHPEFLQLCEMILGEEIDLGLVTNGVLWTPEHTEVLQHAKWVRFSIDAGCAETYASYRHARPEAYDKVREAVRQLTRSRKSNISDRPLVGVGFVVNDRNWLEVVEATKRARDDGADNLRISALFQPQGAAYFRNFYAEAKEACREAASLATETFTVFNMFCDRLQDLFAASPDYSFCGTSRMMTYLGADCTVYTCCMNAYNERGILGSFKDQRLVDLWTSSLLIEKLFSLDATQCPPCMYNGKNAAIAYAMDPLPPHVNFV